jgi:hypothetical protein
MWRLIGLRREGLFCILCLGFIGLNWVPAVIANDNKQSQQKNQTTMNKDKNDEIPFACNIAALNKDQRARYSALTKKLVAEKQEVRELPDGYAFRFAPSSERIKDLAEFITYERLCCPFFDFDLSVERNDGSLWLKLKGRLGVKEFIKSEFGI